MRWAWTATLVVAWFVACGGASDDLVNFKKPDASVDSGVDAPAKLCTPNQSVACVGPAGCVGGQLCLKDGSGYGKCDCGNPPDANGDAPACVPNQSVPCVGPGGCAGGQVCNSDGSGFGACDCGSPPDASSDGPVCIPNQSIACVGPGGCAGGQVCKSDGSGYEACDCGENDAGTEAGTDSGTEAGVDAGADANTGPLAPDQIPGLSLWLDSTKGITPNASVPNQVAVWADQSPHGNAAKNAATSLEPVLVPAGFKSFDVVEFNVGGSSRYLSVDDDSSLQFGTGDFAIVFVMRAPVAQSPTIWDKGGAGSGFNVTLDANVNVITPTASAHAYLPTPSSVHVIAIRGPALSVRVDGTTTTGTTNTSDLSYPGSMLNLGTEIGANTYATIDFLQIIAYKAAVNDAQITGLETYLKNKYGL